MVKGLRRKEWVIWEVGRTGKSEQWEEEKVGTNTEQVGMNSKNVPF
jgi:hypothetical protein